MNTSISHKSLLTAGRHFHKATIALKELAESISPQYVPRIRRAYKKRIPAQTVKPKGSILTNRIPPHLMKRIKAVTKPVHKRLTLEEANDIELLLTQTDLTVDTIAKMFGVTRAAIYNLRDARKLNVHKGSRALMAGIARKRAIDKKVEEMAEPAIPNRTEATELAHV